MVNDNDYVPQGLSRPATRSWEQPWAAAGGSGWSGPRDGSVGSGSGSTDPAKVASSRRFSFNNANGSGAFTFDPDANPDTHALTDWLAYDDGLGRNGGFHPVSDLKLSCVYRRQSGDGPLEAAAHQML